MSALVLRRATRDDAGRMNAALACLSADLGDPHQATPGDLATAGFRPEPAFHAILAEDRAGDANAPLAGVAVYSPLFSTMRGGAGVYVSDLWVAPAARGTGLGRRLLQAVRDDAERVWGVRFLKLAAYEDNPSALAFYARLGFVHHEHERYLTLDAAGLAALGEAG